MRFTVWVVLGAALGAVGQAEAGCFDRTMAIARYHYLNPTDLHAVYQDIYVADFSVTPAAITRLTGGALAGQPFDNTQPQFGSSNPDKIVFVSNRSGTTTNLYAVDAADTDGDGEGDGLVALTSFQADAEDPAVIWSNMDDRLVFASNVSGGAYQLHIAEPDYVSGGLSNDVEITAGAGDKISPFPSRAASYVVFTRHEGEPGSVTQAIDAWDSSTGAVSTLIDRGAIDRDPTLLFGATTTLTFASDRAGGGLLDLFSVEVDLSLGQVTGVPVAITNTPDLDETSPRYTRDGECLAYLAADHSITYGPNDDLYVVELETGAWQRMTSTRDIAGFAWKE